MATVRLLEAELAAALGRLAPHDLTGVVRAGAGVPVALGRAVRAAGGSLVVVLPAQGALPTPLPAHDRAAAGELLFLADHVRLLEFDPRDPGACAVADEQIINTCHGVIAVWDGSPAVTAQGVAPLVAYARGRDLPVEVVWPAGAERLTFPAQGTARTDGTPQ
ncbi:hypothetical protein [Streptomyces atratus]|nr:hypothetical protein [Streptomyces atratus]